MTSIMASSDTSSYMASDMDEEGLIAFNAMAKEAMKIERLVIQQKELGKKLGELLKKTKQSEEKARDRQKHLQSDIHSYASKNKLLKENLNGKKNTRKMVEQMTCDLERQLHLERNDIANKLQGFKQTERKYTDMWQQYENVYLSSSKAKELKQVQAAREEARVCLSEHETEKEALKKQIKQIAQERAVELGVLVVKFAGLARTYSAVKEKARAGVVLLASLTEACTREQLQVQHLKQQLASRGVCEPSESVAASESMVVESSTDREETTEQNNQKKTDSASRSRYKNLLSFDLITLPELELPDLDLGSVDLPEEEVMDDFSHRYEQLGENDLESNSSVTGELSRPASPIITLPVSVCQSPLVDPEPIEESPEPIPQDTEMTEAEQEGPAQEEEIGQQELQETLEQPPIPAPETEGQEEETNEQPNVENMQEEEPQQQDAMSTSDGWESCVGEQLQSPYYHSAMSQSSAASSLELLDDEKRKAYMLKLMASPEFSVEQRAIEEAQMELGGQPSSQQRSAFVNHMYQMFTQSAPASDTASQFSNENPFPTEAAENNNQDIAQEESQPETATLPSEQPASSFAPMSSLFGPPADQQQAPQPTSEPAAFNFGSFSFGSSAPQSSGPANFFGGGNNPFGDPSPTQRGSEAFNLNFDNKSNTSSIFKLF